jgi:hypothetical protein
VEKRRRDGGKRGVRIGRIRARVRLVRRMARADMRPMVIEFFAKYL